MNVRKPRPTTQVNHKAKQSASDTVSMILFFVLWGLIFIAIWAL